MEFKPYKLYGGKIFNYPKRFRSFYSQGQNMCVFFRFVLFLNISSEETSWPLAIIYSGFVTSNGFSGFSDSVFMGFIVKNVCDYKNVHFFH